MTLVTLTDKWFKCLPFRAAVLTFVRINEFQTSLLWRGHNTNTKTKSVFISASAPRTNYTWMQGNSPHPHSGNVEAFGSGLQGRFSFAPSPPNPPPLVRKRAVNLLRLTPGFVPDVYLVCKKCFYLLSKYVWAQRVMMLLYRSGRETMVKGCKCWSPLTHSHTHTLSLLYSPSLLLALPCTLMCMGKLVHAHKHALSLSQIQTAMHEHTHINTHTHMPGPCCPIPTPPWPFWLLFVSPVCRVTRTFLSRPLGSVHPPGTDQDPMQPFTPDATTCWW